LAYEVTYQYHEKLDEGGYDLSEVKALTKRYGKGFEEMSLDKLAANVITQLSRRDIWITDVKVFEFVKKEIKFRETKGGGIVLAGRKFTLDGSQSLDECDENSPSPQIVQPQQMIVSPSQSPASRIPQMVSENRRPIRHMIFTPPPELMEFARVLKLTVNQKYPVYEEKAADETEPKKGMIYYVRDNTGRGIWVRWDYFTDAPPTQLSYESQIVAPQMPSPRSGSGFVDSVRYEAEGAWNIPDIAR
jgi:hypothetical protein